MWGEVFKTIFSIGFLFTVIRVSTPIIFAGLGGLIARRAGVMNMTLEGTMLTSALVAVLCSFFGGSIWIGLLGGMIAGTLIGLLLWYIGVQLQADLYLTAIAINLMASGGTVFALFVFSGDKGNSSNLPSGKLPYINIPLIKDIPVIGELISGHHLLTYIAFICVIIVFYFLFKTPTGLRIRAVGENPNAAESVGVNVKKIKLIALLLSGFFASLGGVFMSMGYVEYFNRDMVAGRGFIGMSAMNVANAHPIGTMFTSILFGIAEAFSFEAQNLGIPREFVYMVPYLATILGLVIFAMQQNRKNKRVKVEKEKELEEEQVEERPL